MKTFKEFVNEATIGDFFKNQVEILIQNEKEDKQLFIDCKNIGKKILEDDMIVTKCKNYIISAFSMMGYKGLNNSNIILKYYEPENIIIGLVPDGVFVKFGKTGKSVSMRKTNMIVFEKSAWDNDVDGWIPHEIGHVVSWRDYKDIPKIKNQFITADKFGSWDNVFNPKDCFGHNTYPNVWLEYIPFTTQIKYLLKNNKSENVIRLMMKDYEENNHTKEELKKYEQIFINFLNVTINKDSGIKNKYNEVINENKKEEKEKLRKKQEAKYLSKDERKKLDAINRRILLFKRKDYGGMNDEDVPLVTTFTKTPPEEKED